MKTLFEYIQKKHISLNVKEIHSSDDLEHGDYFRAEWNFKDEKYWLIGKFNKIGFFTKETKVKTVIFDFCISKTYINDDSEVQVNGLIGLETTSKIGLKYCSPSDNDVELLQEVENYVIKNGYTKLYNTETIDYIGKYDEQTNKLTWQ